MNHIAGKSKIEKNNEDHHSSYFDEGLNNDNIIILNNS